MVDPGWDHWDLKRVRTTLWPSTEDWPDVTGPIGTRCCLLGVGGRSSVGNQDFVWDFAPHPHYEVVSFARVLYESPRATTDQPPRSRWRSPARLCAALARQPARPAGAVASRGDRAGRAGSWSAHFGTERDDSIRCPIGGLCRVKRQTTKTPTRGLRIGTMSGYKLSS
jgi:hypothetical protein